MSLSRARPASAFGSPKAVIERNQGEEQAFSAQVADRQRGVAMLEVLRHSDRSLAERAYCPPAPKPQPHPLKPIALIRTLKRNPLECWATQHFEQPIVADGLPLWHALRVHEPNAIRPFLLDNAANYRKDRLQRRVLSAGLNEGLLGAEGEQWRLPRCGLSLMFARQTGMDFSPSVVG